MSAATLGLCLLLAAAGDDAAVFVPATQFTLAWTHTIEKTRWEEDYALRNDATASPGPALLHAVSARIRGSGAGMEPPPGAILREGWYHYAPALPPTPELPLSRSFHAADYELCLPGQPCRRLSHWLPSDGGMTWLRACSRGAVALSATPR